MTIYFDENTLVNDLETKIDPILGMTPGKFQLVVRELDANRGRADIVVSRFQGEPPSQLTLALYRDAFSEINKARIFAWLVPPNTVSTFEYLKTATGLSSPILNKHLRELSNLGVIEQTKDQLYRITKGFKVPKVEIWTFEAKLKNWKRALYQVQQYRGFSHRVVVVMPEEQLRLPLKHIEMFKILGIGLAGIDVAGRIKFALRPKKTNPFSASHYYFAIGQSCDTYLNSQIAPRTEIVESYSPLPQVSAP